MCVMDIMCELCLKENNVLQKYIVPLLMYHKNTKLCACVETHVCAHRQMCVLNVLGISKNIYEKILLLLPCKNNFYPKPIILVFKHKFKLFYN